MQADEPSGRHGSARAQQNEGPPPVGKRRIPAVLLALTACMAALPPAHGIVIRENTLYPGGQVSDGWVYVKDPTNCPYCYRLLKGEKVINPS